MITSMTGYGKAVLQLPEQKITVEIRTLNSKNLDLNMRLPSAYREKELEMRKMSAAQLSRGKVDLSLHVEDTSKSAHQQLNITTLENYIQQLSRVEGVEKQDRLKLIEIATTFPDIFSVEQDAIDEDTFSQILELIDSCLDKVQEYRNQEGSILENDFNDRISSLQDLLLEVKHIDKDRLDEVRSRLERAVADISEKVDDNRFEQELIYYLEKYDITEEKVRLKNHLDYFKETMDLPGSQGKKLGFISQEIGREINTIGSKANHAAMQQIVVRMKDELEKIKEQLLNVL
jgi:uncharacterized protein (TIGR00255 family)